MLHWMRGKRDTHLLQQKIWRNIWIYRWINLGYQYFAPSGLRSIYALLPGTACLVSNISPLRGSGVYVYTCQALRAWLPISCPYGTPGHECTPTWHCVTGYQYFAPTGFQGLYALLPDTTCLVTNISPLRGSGVYRHSYQTLCAWVTNISPLRGSGDYMHS